MPALGASSQQPQADSGTSPIVPRQNWILDPKQDALFIIAAPILALLLALSTFHFRGAAEAAALIILVHMVMTVAHHLPTFIRIYGDVDLFRRFKWTFLFGPLVPLCFAAGVLIYMNVHQVPVENFLYLFIMLALWDPYHFLMQHYGFMRIYDRHNVAPRRLAARMDLALCVSWFVFIMLASADWLPGILDDLYRTADVAAFMAVPVGAIPFLTTIAGLIAAATSAAYAGYLIWCRRRGYFISPAKLALFALTFGAMYLAYTPNSWIQTAAPGWSFKVGFAVLGIVHMTQYLAIVWRYNRSLAVKPQRARAGVFQRLHLRGGWLVALCYVAVCLLYGEGLTGPSGGRWLLSVLMAAGFTSTLMHYYFDGFIWKMRHQQNRENLTLNEGAGESTLESNAPLAQTQARQQNGTSWWNSDRRPDPSRILLRQSLYFGIPMAVLTAGAITLWSGTGGGSYVGHMYKAQLLSQQGEDQQARSEAEAALASMSRQLPFVKRLEALQPSSAREAELAYLIYNQSKYRDLLLPTLAGEKIDDAELNRYRSSLSEASGLLAEALQRGGPLSHPGHDKMTVDEGSQLLQKWQTELQKLQASSAEPLT